jgi:putative DNA primase/helicase
MALLLQTRPACIDLDPGGLARALGGEAYGDKVLAPGPGHSDRDRSLAVTLDPDTPEGFLVHSFAGDDWRACRDHVRHAAGLPSFAFNPRARPPRRPEPVLNGKKQRNCDLALGLWHDAEIPLGSPVERYLHSRGLAVTSEVLAADVLRFHPACPFKLTSGQLVRLPAMVALMRDIVTNEPCAIHRTALKPNGSGKAEMPDGTEAKKMLGPAKGAVIKLIADEDVTIVLGIAEGIETALTAICADWRPVWACGSAGAIKAFPVLPGIEALTIFADADKNGVGQEVARACARRWAGAGREATVILPPDDGSDWNDVGRAAA